MYGGNHCADNELGELVQNPSGRRIGQHVMLAQEIVSHAAESLTIEFDRSASSIFSFRVVISTLISFEAE